MAGALRKYAFINAKLRARISKIIPDELLGQMIRSHSLPEAIQLLRDTSFSVIESVYNKTGDLKMGELELFKKEVNLYLELERFVQGSLLSFIRALASRYELDNLKNALRLWFDRTVRGRSIEGSAGYLYREKIHYDLHLDHIINAGDMEGVIAALKATPYAETVEQSALRVKEKGSIFPVDIALDHYFYRQILKETEKLSSRDHDLTRRLIGVEIDLQNINWLVRFKSFYNLPLEEAVRYMLPQGFNIDRDTVASAYASQPDILSWLIQEKYSAFAAMLTSEGTRAPSGSESYSRLILVERILEQIMMAEVRHVLAGYPFTIGIILAYFILKRNESKKIMTILNARYYDLPEDRIKSVL